MTAEECLIAGGHVHQVVRQTLTEFLLDSLSLNDGSPKEATLSKRVGRPMILIF